MSSTNRSPAIDNKNNSERSTVHNTNNVAPHVEINILAEEERRNSTINATTNNESTPLLEVSGTTPKAINTKPPLARLELLDDDIDDDDREVVTTPYPGVDDGFFSNGGKPKEDDNPDVETVPSNNPEDTPALYPRNGADDVPDGGNPRRSLPGEKPFPYPPGYGPDVEVGGSRPDLDSIPDINVYQHKKTLAQGMMDLALLSANANQLRYVLESYDRHPYFYPSLAMISISLILQV